MQLNQQKVNGQWFMTNVRQGSLSVITGINNEKISYYFLFMLVFVGCGNDDEKELMDLVKDEIVEDEFDKKITWKKDDKEMMLIPSGSFEMGDHFNEGNEDEVPMTTLR